MPALRVFINGVNAKTGGGKSILSNYLALLLERKSEDVFFVVTPDYHEFKKFSCKHIQILDLASYLKSPLFSLYTHTFVLPRLIARFSIDVVLNFGDIPLSLKVRQIYLFDWSYAIYPESLAWSRMDISGWLWRSSKLLLFRYYLKCNPVVIAQTTTAKKRLERIYGLSGIVVVPNAVSLEHGRTSEPIGQALPKHRWRFLYLTHYYTHKNIEIFLPLAELIKKHRLPFSLVTTIDGSQHQKARNYLKAIDDRGLSEIIVNIGSVRMEQVPTVFHHCDVMLMPTLLESFSGTYVEAFYHRKPVITSNYDFARDVCKNAALYIDPLDTEAILSAMIRLTDDPDLRSTLVENGTMIINSSPTWPVVFEQLQRLVRG